MVDFEKIEDLYSHWLDVNHFTEKNIKNMIETQWTEISGNAISKYTRSVDVKLPKIYLRIDNSALKDFLSIDPNMLISKINDHCKGNYIKEIVFL